MSIHKIRPEVILIACIFQSFGCTSSKMQSAPDKKLPGTVALTPSSFRCEGVVISSDPKAIQVAISKVTERGSSLFYNVSAGDTIDVVYQSPDKLNYPNSKQVEMLIEERPK